MGRSVSHRPCRSSDLSDCFWKGNSPKFVLTAFSEVGRDGVNGRLARFQLAEQGDERSPDPGAQQDPRGDRQASAIQDLLPASVVLVLVVERQ
jgi:hypothetical protein